MNNFRIIYKILKHLEASLDYDETDIDAISHERLGITRGRWEQLMIMLAADGYISGISYSKSLSDGRYRIAEPIQPVITLKGLAYLSENTLMQKAARLAKGIKESVPGI